MQYLVDNIILTSDIQELDADEFIQYWYKFSGKNLKYGNDFAQGFIETNNENIRITVSSDFNIDLNIFNQLSYEYNQFDFTIKSEKPYPEMNNHIVQYHNGIKTAHLNRYTEKLEVDDSTVNFFTYTCDHINKRRRLDKQKVRIRKNNYRKINIIVYDEYYVDYIENNIDKNYQIKDPYKLWFK